MSNNNNKKICDLFCGCGGLSINDIKSSIIAEIESILSEYNSSDRKTSENIQPQINIKFDFTNCNFKKCNINSTKSDNVQKNKKPKKLLSFSTLYKIINFIHSLLSSNSKSDDDDSYSNVLFT